MKKFIVSMILFCSVFYLNGMQRAANKPWWGKTDMVVQPSQPQPKSMFKFIIPKEDLQEVNTCFCGWACLFAVKDYNSLFCAIVPAKKVVTHEHQE